MILLSKQMELQFFLLLFSVVNLALRVKVSMCHNNCCDCIIIVFVHLVNYTSTLLAVKSANGLEPKDANGMSIIKAPFMWTIYIILYYYHSFK